jgi:hypothetical protein
MKAEKIGTLTLTLTFEEASTLLREMEAFDDFDMGSKMDEFWGCLYDAVGSDGEGD